MKTKLLAIALFTLTLGVVVYYPQLFAKPSVVKPPVNHHFPRHPAVARRSTISPGWRGK